MGATATDRFSRREFLRLLDITDKQLAYWEKLGIVSPRKAAGDDFYDFRDLISLRTAKQLIQRFEANFATFEEGVGDDVRAAAVRAAA